MSYIHPLNEDCWMNIVKYVPLEDQLSLALVSDLLYVVVGKQWTRLKVATFTDDILRRFTRNESLMHHLIRNCCRSLLSLQLEGGSLELLRSWDEYCFPKLHTFDSEMYYDEEQADQEALILLHLFPQLKKLTLHSSTNGRHLWSLRNLKELHLIWCENLNTQTFQQIFSSLRLEKLSLLYYGYNVNLGDGLLAATTCTSLQEIVMDDHHLLGNVLPNILLMPRLRTLAFYSRDYYEHILTIVAMQKPHKVISLMFNDTYWNSDRITEAILRMTNLRKIVLHDDDVDNDILFRICNFSSNLEELHLRKMRSVPIAAHLWDLIECCQSLKVLSLCNTELEEGFVQMSAMCLVRVLESRRCPLKVHVYNTGLENFPNVTDIIKHPNLILSLDPLPVNTRTSRFVEIGFTPDEP